MPRHNAGGQSESLFKQLTQSIAVAILSGDLKAGELVPLGPGADSPLAPSRSAYREAIKYLSAKGLVEARQRSGTRVAPRSSWNLLDPDILRWALDSRIDEEFVKHLYELRFFVEPNAARLAAERGTRAQKDAIREALEEMEDRPPYSDEIIDSDVAFHEAILAAANNPALLCLRSMITSTLHWSMRLQRGKGAREFALPLADHRRVYEAIRDRKPEQAHVFMTALVVDALNDTLQAFWKVSSVALRPEAAE